MSGRRRGGQKRAAPEETSADPAAIPHKMMDLPFCHMHGAERARLHLQRPERPVHRQALPLLGGPVRAPGPARLTAPVRSTILKA